MGVSMPIYAKWIEEDGRFAFELTDNGGTEISEARRDALLAEESTGKVLKPDTNGFPIAMFAAPPTGAQLAERERVWRDTELASVMWLRERHRDQLEIEAPTSINREQFRELLHYMQELRDWPQSADFPNGQKRPAAPLWVNGELVFEVGS